MAEDQEERELMLATIHDIENSVWSLEMQLEHLTHELSEIAQVPHAWLFRS